MKLIQKTFTSFENLNKKQFLVYMVFVSLIILIDQFSKLYVDTNFYVGESVPVIDGFFNLTYVRNSGAAFGFGGGFHNWIRYSLFLALPVLACFWLLILLIQTIQKDILLAVAYTMILGGAIGNLIDRFRLDFVVDFFDFYYGKNHFATFNIADSAISIAAFLLILDYFLKLKSDKKK